MVRCVWCAEDVSAEAEECSSCGRTQTGEEGKPLRRIDLLYESVVKHQREAYRNAMTWGVAGFAVVSVTAPLFSIAAPVVVALLLAAHMILLRLYLFRDSFRLLGVRRRFFVRWITRLGLLVAGSFGYSTTLAPIAGALTGAGTFAVLTAATNAYVLRSLKRERLGLPLELWEKLTLVFLAIALVAMVAAAIVVGALIGWSISELGDVFQ